MRAFVASVVSGTTRSRQAVVRVPKGSYNAPPGPASSCRISATSSLAGGMPGASTLDLGIVAFGDALPSVERDLGERRIGEHPEPVGGNGVRYQLGHGGRRIAALPWTF